MTVLTTDILDKTSEDWNSLTVADQNPRRINTD